MKSPDPILDRLLIGMFLLLFMMIFVEWKFPNDGQVFQVFVGLAGSFGGAFLLRVKPQSKEPSDATSITPVIPNPPEGAK